MLLWLIHTIKNLLVFARDLFKYTRGVRIIKCKVDEKGNKIVIFQALGSFHSEEISYEEYKNGLIYDTDPSDVEKVSIFFHYKLFDKYNIYSFDPINMSICITNAYQNNTLNITSENWEESLKYLQFVNHTDVPHIIHSIINFEINKHIQLQEEAELEDIHKIQENSECNNILQLNKKRKTI